MAETFDRAAVKLTTTNPTEILQAPTTSANSRAIVLSCIAANVNTTNAVEFTLTIANSTGTEISKIGQNIVIPPKASVEFIVNKQVLLQGEKLVGTATIANYVDVNASVLKLD